MARKKAILKAKEFVRLREKSLANGNKSLYLDIYKDGKREYEFLKLYLIPESNKTDKLKNEETLHLAEAIKAQRQKDIVFEQAGVNNSNRGKILLQDYIEQYYKEYIASGKKECAGKVGALGLAVVFGGNIQLKSINKQFYFDFVDFLRNKYTHNGKHINETTIHNAVNNLSIVLNHAVERGILQYNPFNKIAKSERIKKPEAEREFLTIEEIGRLIKTPMCNNKHNDVVKNMFLFSCFAGLRLSDVEALKWENIYTTNGETRIHLRVQKTSRMMDDRLPQQAIAWLPEKGTAKPSDKVFECVNRMTLGRQLDVWIKSAGINKHITFHCARHSYATTMLSIGVPIETISKKMGHTDIQTTQIYAKVLEKSKNEASDLLDTIDFGQKQT